MIELHPAYFWDCPECGRENFVRGISPEFTDEDLQVLKAEHGVQPWETGDFVMMPTNVECGECHAEFPVELDEN